MVKYINTKQDVKQTNVHRTMRMFKEKCARTRMSCIGLLNLSIIDKTALPESNAFSTVKLNVF